MNRARQRLVRERFTEQGDWRVRLSDQGRVWATGPGYPGLAATVTADEPSGIGQAIGKLELEAGKARRRRR